MPQENKEELLLSRRSMDNVSLSEREIWLAEMFQGYML